MSDLSKLLSLVPLDQERFRRKLSRSDGSECSLRGLVRTFIGARADGPWGDWRDDAMAVVWPKEKPVEKPEPSPPKAEPPKPPPKRSKSTHRGRS